MNDRPSKHSSVSGSLTGSSPGIASLIKLQLQCASSTPANRKTAGQQPATPAIVKMWPKSGETAVAALRIRPKAAYKAGMRLYRGMDRLAKWWRALKCAERHRRRDLQL